MIDVEELWRRIEEQAGEEFRQIRGKNFTYEVKGNSVVLLTTNRLIPKSNFREALGVVPLANTVPVQGLQGPSYIFAIMMDPRIRRADW